LLATWCDGLCTRVRWCEDLIFTLEEVAERFKFTPRRLRSRVNKLVQEGRLQVMRDGPMTRTQSARLDGRAGIPGPHGYFLNLLKSIPITRAMLQQSDIAGHHQALAPVPAGTIENHHGMSIGGDLTADLTEMVVHGGGIADRHDQRRFAL
jgi:hypothetical protein